MVQGGVIFKKLYNPFLDPDLQTASYTCIHNATGGVGAGSDVSSYDMTI